MDTIRTAGPTTFFFENPYIREKASVSIISRRAAKIAIKLSSRTGKWKMRIVPYSTAWKLLTGDLIFLVIGFQPESGYHIAVKYLEAS